VHGACSFSQDRFSATERRTVLAATRHRWMCPTLTPARQAGTKGTWLIYPGGIEGWVDPGERSLQRWSDTLATTQCQHSTPLAAFQLLAYSFVVWCARRSVKWVNVCLLVVRDDNERSGVRRLLVPRPVGQLVSIGSSVPGSAWWQYCPWPAK